jgi:hypothetical protein
VQIGPKDVAGVRFHGGYLFHGLAMVDPNHVKIAWGLLLGAGQQGEKGQEGSQDEITHGDMLGLLLS